MSSRRCAERIPLWLSHRRGRRRQLRSRRPRWLHYAGTPRLGEDEGLRVIELPASDEVVEVRTPPSLADTRWRL